MKIKCTYTIDANDHAPIVRIQEFEYKPKRVEKVDIDDYGIPNQTAYFLAFEYEKQKSACEMLAEVLVLMSHSFTFRDTNEHLNSAVDSILDNYQSSIFYNTPTSHFSISGSNGFEKRTFKLEVLK